MKKQHLHIGVQFLIFTFLWGANNSLLWGQADSMKAWILYQQAEAASSQEAAIAFANDALILGEKSKDDQLKLNTHQLLARIWFQKERLPLSLRHYLQVQNLAKKSDLRLSRPRLHWEMGNLYESWEVHDKAFKSFQLILKESNEAEQKDWELRALAGMARTKAAANEPLEALSYYEKLRKIFRAKNDPAAELAILRSIIRLQKESLAFQEALKSNQEALRLNEQARDTAEIIISLNNIGVLYRQLERYEESLTYFIQASEMEELFETKRGSNPITLSNIGILYQNLNDYPNSLKYLKRAELQTQLASVIDSSLLSSIKNLLAIIYLNSNESTNAYFYNKEAIDIAKKLEEPALLQLYYKTKSNIDEQVGAFEEALQYYRLHTNILDSLGKNQQAQREKDVQKRFSAEQTEKEMSLLLVDKEIAELKLRQDELENDRLKQENFLKEQQLKIAQQEIERQEAEQVLLNTQNQLLSEQKDRQITLLEKEQSEAELILTGERLKREQQDRAIAQAEREQAESNLALQEKDFQIQQQQESIIRNTIIGGLVTSLLVLILLIRTARLRRRATVILASQKQELEETLNRLKQTQTQLIQAEKMASLGALTAGVAHEINNPLNFVTSNTHALKIDLSELKLLLDEVHKLKEKADGEQLNRILEKIEELDTEFLNEEVQQLVESIERGAQRTKNIVLGLRTFSRSANDEFVLADIHEGLDSTLTILNSKLKGRIEVHKDYGKIPQIPCQFDKLNQVFMNILSNAIQAIDEEGHIYLKTSRKGKEVIISIEDTGSGIPQHLKERIFEPFFTTKGIGEGTGLGLSISYGIIEAHEGRIDLESKEGKGSRFSIILPLKQDKASTFAN